MPVTLRFQSSGKVPSGAGPVEMRGPSLTVGRADDNDIVLPDPERMVSKHHCVIEAQGGSIVAVDLSTNGTFLNYGKVPIGKSPAVLNDGDILSVGSYELLVEVPVAQPAGFEPLPPAEEDLLPQLAGAGGDLGDLLDAPASNSDFLDDLIGEADRPVGAAAVSRPELGEDGLLPPLGEDDGGDPLASPRDPQDGFGASQADHSPSVNDPYRPPGPSLQAIPEDWDDLIAPQAPQDKPVPPVAPAAPASRDALLEPPAAAPTSAPPATPVIRAGAGNAAAARAFLSTLGAGGLDIPEEELVPTLSRLGHVLRILLHGTRDILATRTSIKSEFRIAQTMIAPRGNNPLKFAVSPEQAVEAMVKPSTEGYLDSPEAAEQAMDDIRAHEVATMTGMEAALRGVLARLSPEALEKEIELSAGIGDMLKGKKARYWEAYEKMYAQISDKAENEFFELFAREFAKAYQEQLERLKKS